MDLEQLVRRACEGDVSAFVELTRRFQHFAFGSALALLGDFQHAEDAVQEAFLAAWSGLPSLSDHAAFPGWLRGIVRHQAFRTLRKSQLEIVPLESAENIVSEQISPDDDLVQREHARAALAAIAELPVSLREPATLFYIHECSHQDIANFLGISVTTVNNRLHAARSKLKERMLTMVAETLQAHGLPDDFANRIGRLVGTRGDVIEALFDPQSLPDLLAELAVSDEANRRTITVQVVQRPGKGIVRAVIASPSGKAQRGATVLNSLHHAAAPIDGNTFGRAVRLLAGPRHRKLEPKLLETGIKVFDVLCPLVVGGTVAIAGEFGAGTTVVMEELVRRLSGGADRISLFTLVQRWKEEDFSYAAELKKDGFSEGTIGAVQTFFFRAGDGPWTTERLAELASVDTVIHLSRGMAERKIYPCVDPRTSRSELLGTKAVGDEHAEIAARVKQTLTLLLDPTLAETADPLTLTRARKLANFFSQPFFCAEPWTKRPGSHVSATEALRTCAEILAGVHDDLPTAAFYFAGGIGEIRASAQQ
ncbi:MAG: sigma-70 family RNA polymerase sigma factor [Alphaproteobacteria bacterium]|nr:sigma-70 family RNA polymerase sigma factor [Alphaproteobacteria bacterium]